MADLIDREAILACIPPEEIVARMAVAGAPTVDAEPVRHGVWEGFVHSAYYGMDDDGEPIYRDKIIWYCSNRKCRRKTVVRERYCPSCGAKMDGR